MKKENVNYSEHYKDNDMYELQCKVEECKAKLFESLSNYRKSKKISQTELADKINSSQKAISFIESNKCSPNLNTLLKYLFVLDIDLSEVFKKEISGRELSTNNVEDLVDSGYGDTSKLLIILSKRKDFITSLNSNIESMIQKIDRCNHE